MNPSLRGYVTAVIDTAGSGSPLAGAAGELAQVEAVWSASLELRSALADSSMTTAVRRAVIEDLFSSKVSGPVLRILLRIVGRNKSVEHSADLRDATDLVRHAAESGLSGDAPEGAAPLGRSGARDFMSGYAAAVLEGVGTRADLEEIEDELFRFARIVESAPELEAMLSDWSRPVTGRQELVADLIRTKVSASTLALVQMAVSVRARHLIAALDHLVEQTAEARGWRLARVVSASDIAEADKAQLSSALQALAGVPVDLQVTLDPTLLGGAVVSIGDVIVDASAKHRLGQLREHLLGPEGATRRVKEAN